MNIYDNNTQSIGPDARDFLGGNYLKKEDLNGTTVVTLIEVRSETLPGESRRKLVVSFREFEKPLILNKTNTRRLAEIFRTTDTGLWRGQISLYVEDNVEYGGQVVGGIRVQPATVRATSNGPTVEQVPTGNGVPGLTT